MVFFEVVSLEKLVSVQHPSLLVGTGGRILVS